MRHDKLVSNAETEFIIIGTRQQLAKINIEHITVGCNNITPSTTVRNLQSQPKVSGHPQTKALPRFPSFNVATVMSTFLSIFF